MSKAYSKAGKGIPPAVGRPVLQIAFPFDFDDGGANDTASAAENNRTRPSGAATPTGRESNRRRKWYSLYDKVYADKNLRKAWEHVRSRKGAPGVDGLTIGMFEQNADENLQRLQQQLKEKRYRTRPVRRKEIPKDTGGTRVLGIPSVPDRVVQQAVAQVLTPIFELKFSDQSHGFRPGRGCQTALRIVDRAIAAGYHWIAEADISKFFDNVDHELLLSAVNEEVADGSVLWLIRQFLESGILTELDEVDPTPLGTPQGGPLSPLLANIHLHPLDVALQQMGVGLVRYADDFVILARSQDAAEQGLAKARELLEGLRLQLHPEKTRVGTIDDGFDFLGYHYHRDAKGMVQKTVSAKSIKRFRNRVRSLTKRHAGQKRPKAKRCTLPRLKKNQRVLAIIERLNRFLRGWHGYYRLVQVTWQTDYLDDFDRFVRRRLRCCITGRYAVGNWNKRLPNSLLDQLGLFCLSQAPTPGDRIWLNPPPSSGYLGGSRVR